MMDWYLEGVYIPIISLPFSYPSSMWNSFNVYQKLLNNQKHTICTCIQETTNLGA